MLKILTNYRYDDNTIQQVKDYIENGVIPLPQANADRFKEKWANFKFEVER